MAPVSFRIADLALLRGADFLSVFDPSQRQALAIFPLAPMEKEDAPTPELAEAWEYYHTKRAQYPPRPATWPAWHRLWTYYGRKLSARPLG